jgi:amino acid permease
MAIEGTNPAYGWDKKDEDDRTVRFDAPHESHDVEAYGTVTSAKDPQYEPTTGTVKPAGTLGPYQAAIIFITNEVGIGILSLPAAFDTLGLIPGLIALLAMGTLSLYAAYNLVQFYRRYPHVVNIVDYGRVIGGKPLEIIFAIGFIINLSMISASAVITMSIGINTISEHAACTVIWIGIACLACWALCVPRTMLFVSHCGWPCTVSIMAAVIIPMAALGAKGPANAPPGVPVNFKLVGSPTFVEAVSAFLNIAFAFTGNQAFVTVMVEMKDPSRDFTKAILIEKPFAMAIYSVVAIVCYVFAGEYVTSPVIGAAPVITAKVSYGIVRCPPTKRY